MHHQEGIRGSVCLPARSLIGYVACSPRLRFTTACICNPTFLNWINFILLNGDLSNNDTHKHTAHSTHTIKLVPQNDVPHMYILENDIVSEIHG